MRRPHIAVEVFRAVLIVAAAVAVLSGVLFSLSGCTPVHQYSDGKVIDTTPSKKKRGRYKRAPVSDLLRRTVQIKNSCTNGWGSGVIIEGSYIALQVGTADHVVDDTDCLYLVVDSMGREFYGTYLKHDPKHDAAVLYTMSGYYAPKLEIGVPQLGDGVVTTGYPYDRLKGKAWLTVTRGHVAANYGSSGEETYRITAPILNGSSGGPCWTRDGKLIGLTVSGIMIGPRAPVDGHYYVTSAQHVYNLLSL